MEQEAGDAMKWLDEGRKLRAAVPVDRPLNLDAWDDWRCWQAENIDRLIAIAEEAEKVDEDGSGLFFCPICLVNPEDHFITCPYSEGWTP